MKQHTWIIIFLFGFFLFNRPFTVLAANNLDVVINEIAWMGTAVSYNDEWLELYNNANSPLSLEGWTIKASDGSPEISLTGNIPANGFYLLERTNDDTLPGIAADLIYKGALGNDGEILTLYDNSGNVIDSVNCGGGWFAGDNSTKQTMERMDPLTSGNAENWKTSQNPQGTPKAKNNSVAETNSPPPAEPALQNNQEPQLEPVSQPNLEPGGQIGQTHELKAAAQPISYPSGILINEILPSPIGADDEEEWIELFNENSFEVNLAGWQIADTLGAINTYIFPKETVIGAEGFLLLSRPTTKIVLNNDTDGLNLIRPDGEVSDGITYEKSPRGESFNRTDSGAWVWSKKITPGSLNIIFTANDQSLASGASEKNLNAEEKTGLNKNPRELAAVGQQTSLSPGLLFIILTALGLAVVSAVTALIIKNRAGSTPSGY